MSGVLRLEGCLKQSVADSQVMLIRPPCNFLWGEVGVTRARIFQEKRLV